MHFCHFWSWGMKMNDRTLSMVTFSRANQHVSNDTTKWKNCQKAGRCVTEFCCIQRNLTKRSMGNPYLANICWCCAVGDTTGQTDHIGVHQIYPKACSICPTESISMVFLANGPKEVLTCNLQTVCQSQDPGTICHSICV